MTENILDPINNNYEAAKRFIRSNSWVYPLMGFFLILFIVAIAVDFALSHGFFSKLAENELGVVPNEKRWLVFLKALPPLAIPFIFKEAFMRMPKILQLSIYFMMLVLSIFIAINMGNSQTIPIIRDSLENIFPSTPKVNSKILRLLGDDTKLPSGFENQEDNDNGQKISSKTAKRIGKEAFINSLRWYGLAFLLMSFLSTIALIHISQLNNIGAKLNKAFSFKAQYKKLIKKKKELMVLQQGVNDLISNQGCLQRTAQDIVVRNYSIGLDYPRFLLGELKMYGIKKGDSNRYVFMQSYRYRWVRQMNIESCDKMIEEANKSIQDLILYDLNNDKRAK